MLIRLFWPACTFGNKNWGAEPVDAFWVEATQEEAEAGIFPHMEPAAVGESRALAERSKGMAAKTEDAARPFCFLVTRDLSRVDAFPANYPFHHMWNGYSPFREMPGVEIAALEEVRKIDLRYAGDRS